MDGLTLEFGRRAACLHIDAFPPDVVRWAKIAIADTLAVALAGAEEPPVQIVRDALASASPQGPCRIFGASGLRAPPLDAALVNGVAGHVLDFDDCSIILDGHPTVPMVPAIAALAETQDASGAAVIEAYVAGFEVEVRLARHLSGGELRPKDRLPIGERGWHPTGVFGAIGSAAACGRLLGLEPARMAAALSIAASSAAGLRANSGTMTKSLHAGHANRNGLWAALLASRGFTANTGAIEHRLGFAAAYNGQQDDGSLDALKDFGVVFELSGPGVSIKHHPCCSYTFPAIDAAIELRRRPGFDASRLDRVTVKLHERCVGNVNRPKPSTPLDAKFSTQYVTACALVNGHVRLDDFEPEALKRTEILGMMARISLGTHAQDDLFLGTVEITGADGTSRTGSASTKFGRGPDDPLSDAEFEAKFLSCSTRAISPSASNALFEALMDLERRASFAEVLALID